MRLFIVALVVTITSGCVDDGVAVPPALLKPAPITATALCDDLAQCIDLDGCPVLCPPDFGNPSNPPIACFEHGKNVDCSTFKDWPGPEGSGRVSIHEVEDWL